MKINWRAVCRETGTHSSEGACWKSTTRWQLTGLLPYMEDGVNFDAVEGVQDKRGQIFVWDGYHRGEAAKKVGRSLLVNLRSGTKTEAEWLALSANQKHGLRRTTADKQQIIRKALLHPNGVKLSNREVARHCGVDHKTVGKIRGELEATGEIPQLSKRLVKKASGETYDIDTTNIGSHQTVSPKDFQSSSQYPTTIIPTHPGEQNIPPVENIQPTCANCGATEPNGAWWSNGAQQLCADCGPYTKSRTDEQPRYQLKPPEFECPRCGQEKIVGVNGSRRWCLNCLAEWPTSAAFLHEVNVVQEPAIAPPTHQQLQDRFLNILARLDDQDAQLGKINFWLDTLEAQLDLAEDINDTEETVSQISSSPVLEYA